MGGREAARAYGTNYTLNPSHYWCQSQGHVAAEKALRRHAYDESLAAVQRGLNLIQRQSADAEHVGEEPLLQLTRGAALSATRVSPRGKSN